MDARDRSDKGGKEKRSVTIELPLPHIALHPNSRPHWGTKARMTKKARETAGLVAKLSKPKSCPWDEATIHMTFYMPRNRDRDGCITWLKSSFDGLQDAGIVENDSGLHMGRVEQVIQKKERKVVLVIEKN